MNLNQIEDKMKNLPHDIHMVAQSTHQELVTKSGLEKKLRFRK